MKRFFIFCAIIILTIIISIFAVNLVIYIKAKPYIYNKISEAPDAQTAIIPGAAVLLNGGLSPILKDRVETAIQLYKLKKVSKIIVSGDNSTVSYNEVNPVRIYLLNRGVLDQDIFLDHAGFNTYSTMYRARDIFKVSSALIVSQSFHLPRAVFIARSLGIDAYGVNADAGQHVLFKNYVREVFANEKAVLNLIFSTKPKYLGEEIPITGDGRSNPPVECTKAKDCQDLHKNCYYSCSSNKCVQIQTFVALKPYPDCSSAVSNAQEVSCSGSTFGSCPVGYKCIQSCGPPVAREGDAPPPYFCELDEIADKPRNCPICLASNTNISTPMGDINVKDIKVGMDIWSLNKKGEKILSAVLKISNTIVPKTHKVIDLVLSDGREVWASVNHPIINGLPIGELNVGDLYDGSKVQSADIIPYWDSKTYDILPAGETGYYWANGILLGSTLGP